MLKFWDIIRPGQDRPTRSAMVFGLVFAAVVGLGTYWDLRQSADGPREVATVVDRQNAGPSFCPSDARGRLDPKWDVTWRSENPPPGQPAEFTQEAVCNWNEVGDRVEIIRVIESGRTTVYQDVVHAGWESLELAMWTFVIAGLFVALPLFWLARWWRKLRNTRFVRGERRSREVTQVTGENVAREAGQ